MSETLNFIEAVKAVKAGKKVGNHDGTVANELKVNDAGNMFIRHRTIESIWSNWKPLISADYVNMDWHIVDEKPAVRQPYRGALNDWEIPKPKTDPHPRLRLIPEDPQIAELRERVHSLEAIPSEEWQRMTKDIELSKAVTHINHNDHERRIKFLEEIVNEHIDDHDNVDHLRLHKWLSDKVDKLEERLKALENDMGRQWKKSAGHEGRLQSLEDKVKAHRETLDDLVPIVEKDHSELIMLSSAFWRHLSSQTAQPVKQPEEDTVKLEETDLSLIRAHLIKLLDRNRSELVLDMEPMYYKRLVNKIDQILGTKPTYPEAG